jgi:hypothetical protein
MGRARGQTRLESAPSGRGVVRPLRRWRPGVRLTMAIAALSLLPFLGRVEAQSPSAAASSQFEGHTADSVEPDLGSRGLLAYNSSPAPRSIEPPAGAEVDETAQTAKSDRKIMARTRAWTEELNRANTLHVEVTSYPSGQSQVAFWVLPRHSRGCTIFGRTMYSSSGTALKSEFWRNDHELKITGGCGFSLGSLSRSGACNRFAARSGCGPRGGSGKINQQVSPYGFVDMQISVENSEPLEVPAGRFAAVRFASQPVVSSILPSWPRFTQQMVSPFMPQSTYYFEAAPPHRLLRMENAGTTFIGGPEATTELVRYYIAAPSATVVKKPARLQGRAP